MEDRIIVAACLSQRLEGSDCLRSDLGEELHRDIAVVGVEGSDLFALDGFFVLVFRVSRVEVSGGNIIDADQRFCGFCIVIHGFTFLGSFVCIRLRYNFGFS